MQTELIISTLKRVLQREGVTYNQLAQNLDMSVANIKKLMNKGPLSLSRLEAICKVLDLDVFELINLAGHEYTSSEELGDQTQKDLLQRPQALRVLRMLVAGYKKEQLAKSLNLELSLVEQELKWLRSKSFIEIKDDRPKVLKARRVLFKDHPALRKKYEIPFKKCLSQSILSHSSLEKVVSRPYSLLLNPDQAMQMGQDINNIISKYSELAKANSYLGKDLQVSYITGVYHQTSKDLFDEAINS